MARVIRMAEERARISESQQAIKKYLGARLGLESKPMQNKIDLITDLYLLHHLLDDLYRAEKREEMARLIDITLEKQNGIRASHIPKVDRYRESLIGSLFFIPKAGISSFLSKIHNKTESEVHIWPLIMIGCLKS
ncbi:hypothetical protein [Anoxybacillus sp. ST70]|uniref:hypothetical protein n=1 Tax=Anoxybacillus sp. ST70 TaxID=2864180 RepID=UPI002105FE41|nr:hypothetical protein [Anoxybacillus sp. ST70]